MVTLEGCQKRLGKRTNFLNTRVEANFDTRFLTYFDNRFVGTLFECRCFLLNLQPLAFPLWFYELVKVVRVLRLSDVRPVANGVHELVVLLALFLDLAKLIAVKSDHAVREYDLLDFGLEKVFEFHKELCVGRALLLDKDVLVQGSLRLWKRNAQHDSLVISFSESLCKTLARWLNLQLVEELVGLDD